MGSELVSVVAGYYISELEIQMAVIAFFGYKRKSLLIDKKNHHSNRSSTVKLQDFCVQSNFAMHKKCKGIFCIQSNLLES